jgi:hypothetical protein
MASEKKERFLQVYGPTTSEFAEAMRYNANLLMFSDPEGNPRSLSAEEQELLVKVGAIFRLNSFAISDNSRGVYEVASCVSHSCLPNCERAFEGDAVVIRAILPIKAGERLTVEYSPDRTESTAERRYKKKEFKDFTCHCPRCDALGDDTRQFDCFDPKCKSRHYACQPLSDKLLTYEGAQYTGVEPHLLPCTACARPPPAEYQARMLAEEKRWETELKIVENAYGGIVQDSYARILDVVRRLDAMKMPRMHGLTLKHTSLCTALLLHTLQGARLQPDAKQQSARTMAYALRSLHLRESITPYPNRATEVDLVTAAHLRLSAQNWVAAKDLCQRAIRMHLLRCGREDRLKTTDEQLVTALQKLPVTITAGVGDDSVTTACCAFCEESPERAALKLSLCGRCEQVTYCSTGCQKAHWKIHKQQCKKV